MEAFGFSNICLKGLRAAVTELIQMGTMMPLHTDPLLSQSKDISNRFKLETCPAK